MTKPNTSQDASKQCCGNCANFALWTDVYIKGRGSCRAKLPRPLPIWVWRGGAIVHESEGDNCPCFEPRPEPSNEA